MDPILGALLAQLMTRRTDLRDAISEGVAADYPTYRYMVGQLAELERVIMEAKQLEKLHMDE